MINSASLPVSAHGSAVLSVRQLRLSLEQAGQSIELIKGVDLDLHAGEVLGLVGESGCGKSLTANAIMGLLPAPSTRLHSERFLLNGSQDLRDLKEPQWRKLRGRPLAMIFQEPRSALDPVFTIGQQMRRVVRRHLGKGPGESRRIVSNSLAECGLGDTERILASYPHQLSGGMLQRAMIAMALSCSPQILIADEVTSALDISSRDQVLVLLRQIATRHGMAILMISHDLAAVARISDRVMVMYSGRIVESGLTAKLLRRPSHPYAAGLLAATPRLNSSARVQPIAGRVHALHEALPGCAFAPRCAAASTICTVERPVLRGVESPEHLLACHHPVPR
jgi:peptide/nickel transport system ATP-binding protein